jgi:hypothetical protein
MLAPLVCCQLGGVCIQRHSSSAACFPLSIAPLMSIEHCHPCSAPIEPCSSSAAWFPLCLFMCQAIKHALQVRNGRVGVSPPKASVSGKQLAQDKQQQQPEPDITPGLVSDDSASVVGDATAGENVRLRLVLGGPYGRTEDYERWRVCREVHDGLASCLDFPPDWLRVSPVECNESGFAVRVRVGKERVRGLTSLHHLASFPEIRFPPLCPVFTLSSFSPLPPVAMLWQPTSCSPLFITGGYCHLSW